MAPEQFRSLREKIEKKETEINLDFILEDLKKLLEDNKEGVEKIAGIVKETYIRPFLHNEGSKWHRSRIKRQLWHY